MIGWLDVTVNYNYNYSYLIPSSIYYNQIYDINISFFCFKFFFKNKLIKLISLANFIA